MEWRNNFTFEQVQAHWDKIAPKYDHHNSNMFNPHNWRFIEGIKYLEPTDKPVKVLSIEARTGGAIPYIRSKLPNAIIHNLEFSSKLMVIAKEKFPKETFTMTRLDKLKLEDNFFDYIISPETMEHVPQPYKLIQEFHRVLKNDGKLILSLPPRIADIHQKVYETIVGSHGDGPRRGISSWRMKRILRDCSFKIIKHNPILLIPIGPKKLILFGDKLMKILPFLRELGIMQFYICKKRSQEDLTDKG